MANNSVKREVTALDPMFYIPEGVDEFVYEDENSWIPIVEPYEEPEIYFEDTFVSEDDLNYYDGPETPDILGVVEQIARTDETGRQVVDVILEVEDLPGVSNYEFRVTRL